MYSTEMFNFSEMFGVNISYPEHLDCSFTFLYLFNYFLVLLLQVLDLCLNLHL